ncbi:MAG TPA: PilZ domain-containing protein [Bryobacteraceae bacterium]|nr:PilZ domain-containing protein [Bryobacteraceae bacterium]HOQ45797.1 PilZ domain-containing protein [Bryobacteraceae bacterium]HPQ16357.1 PilZ domain-containing protein [Bryobacteraceae bacterium]HPU70994.1 PilZ domain-containing protein [Bryobacteraceae bacterium]
MMPERRSEQRLMCAHLVTLRPSAPSGSRQSMTGVLEDISSSGACLQVETAVATGAPMTLVIGRHSFPGTVRYCIFRETGYFIGLQFDTGIRWSRDQVVPEHLLDPSEIKAKTRQDSAPRRNKH